MNISFTANVKAQPKGSIKSYLVPGAGRFNCRAILTSDNAKLKAFQSEVARCAREAMAGQEMAGKHVPMRLDIEFTFMRPKSVPRSRDYPVVKPDIDKLARAVLDALSGIVYLDDAQVWDCGCKKRYWLEDTVTVQAWTLE